MKSRNIIPQKPVRIDNEEVINFDYRNNEGFSTLNGIENINLKSNGPMGVYRYQGLNF